MSADLVLNRFALIIIFLKGYGSNISVFKLSSSKLSFEDFMSEYSSSTFMSILLFYDSTSI